MKVHSSRKIIGCGPSIGWYQGRDIPKWFAPEEGKRHSYVGITGDEVDLSRLKPGQSVIAPGLLYEEEKQLFYRGTAFSLPLFDSENLGGVLGCKMIEVAIHGESVGTKAWEDIIRNTYNIAFIDAGYCIDAPTVLPAGGCVRNVYNDVPEQGPIVLVEQITLMR